MGESVFDRERGIEKLRGGGSLDKPSRCRHVAEIQGWYSAGDEPHTQHTSCPGTNTKLPTLFEGESAVTVIPRRRRLDPHPNTHSPVSPLEQAW